MTSCAGRAAGNADLIWRLVEGLAQRDQASYELAMIRAHGRFDRVAEIVRSRQSMEDLTNGIIHAACDCIVPEALDQEISDDLPGNIDTAYLEAHDALPVLPEFGLRWSAEWAQKCINALNLARVTDSYMQLKGIGKSASVEGYDTFAAAGAAGLAAFEAAELTTSAYEVRNEIRITKSNQWKWKCHQYRPVITSEVPGAVTAWVYFADVPLETNTEWDFAADFLPEYPVKFRSYRIASAVPCAAEEDHWRWDIPHPEPELKEIAASEMPESEDLIRGYAGYCHALLDRGTLF